MNTIPSTITSYPIVPNPPECYDGENGGLTAFINQNYNPNTPEEWKTTTGFRDVCYGFNSQVKLKDVLTTVPDDFNWKIFSDLEMCPTNFTSTRAKLIASGQQLPVCSRDLTNGQNTYIPRNTATVTYSKVCMPLPEERIKESIKNKLIAINEAPKIMMENMKKYNDPQYIYRYYDRNRSIRCLMDSLNGIAGGICGYESALALKELYTTHDTIVAHRIQIYTVAYMGAKLRNHYAIIYLTKKGITECFTAHDQIKDPMVRGMRLDTILAKEIRYYSKANGVEEDCRWADKINESKIVYFMMCNADDDGEPNLFCHDKTEKTLCAIQMRTLSFARRMYREKFLWRQAASGKGNPARFISTILCYYKLHNKPLYQMIMKRTDENYEKVHQEVCEKKMKKWGKKMKRKYNLNK